MNQVQELTKSEQIKMYMKLPKKNLAEMLWNCNEVIKKIPPKVVLRG